NHRRAVGRRQIAAHVLPGVLLGMVGVVAVLLGPLSAQAAPRHQATSPETVLTEAGDIEDWTLGGDFLYWSDYCRPGPSEAPGVLKRRAVNGSIVQTLGSAPDEDECETFIRGGADEAGFYYYNRFEETIEAVYNNEFYSSVTVLADVGFLREVDLSPFVADEEYIYWLEQVRGGEFFLPDELHLRRLSKEGGDVQTLLSYEGSMSNSTLAVNDDWFIWLDGDGLRGVPKSACPGSCVVSELHDVTLTEGLVTLNEEGDIFWQANRANAEARLFHTSCSVGVNCDTDELYEAPEFVDINGLVADAAHIYWTEDDGLNIERLLRMPVGGGAPDILVEGALEPEHLELDIEWVYFKSEGRQRLLRLPLDATAITRELSFRGWEVTQAIQNLENDVPLVAGKTTFVRVYPQLDSGAASGGVELLLHGERDGEPLPGSPLRPENNTIYVDPGADIAVQRGESFNFDTSWLFQLPPTWTKTEDVAIPLEDAQLTLRAEIDPRGLTGDTTPQDNVFEDSFAFNAKAPTCVRTRPVWTQNAYQSSWDSSVQTVLEIAESMHPTVEMIPFPSDKRLEKVKFCRKGIVYGPFCKGPYNLNSNADTLLLKLWRKDFFGGVPAICREVGARTLLAGIVAADAAWDSNGLALRRTTSTINQATVRGNVQLSKVPRFGTFGWPMTRHTHLATTFAHEIGHNYGHLHVDCGGPPDIDNNYPYNPCTLDSRSLTDSTTYFGFDGHMLEPAPPDVNVDYMTYSSPRWISDYHWQKVYNRTHLPEPLVPEASEDPFAAGMDQEPATYLFLSGLITPTAPAGTLESTWQYPRAAASESLRIQWGYSVPETWTGEPYHVRLLGADDEILDDRVVEILPAIDVDPADVDIAQTGAVAQESTSAPFMLTMPAPEAAVESVQLLEGETVLDSYQPSADAPTVEILAPQGGEAVTDELLLEWQAADPDAAPWLEYTVQYTPDDGENWYVLETDVFGVGEGVTESLTLDLRSEPGSDGAEARVRVLASDGYNTAMATSAAFSVAPRAPRVLITSPAPEQWFPAHAPVALRGAAFDPVEGVIDDDGFVWDVDGVTASALQSATPSGSQASVMGLAPGTYTATLEVTNAQAQTGDAASQFYIAPLAIPQTEEMRLNGRCDDAGYGELSLPLLPYADDEVAYAALARTNQYLWVCLQGLKTDDALDSDQDGYAGFQIDVDNNRAAQVGESDRGFFVRMNGAPVTFAGDGNFFTPTEPEGLATRVAVDGNLWRAELRLDVDAIGGWDRRVGLAVGHYFGLGDQQRAAWPHGATLHSPQTWAQTNLYANPVPTLDALTPVSATLGSSTLLTVTGSNFRVNSVVLWNGEAVSTTVENAQTLQVTLDDAQTASAGLHDVQVAPQSTPALASIPRQFLVHHGAPEITGLSPVSVTMESGALDLTVAGTGFVPGATVFWEGEPRPTTFVDATTLTVELAAPDVESARTAGVVAANPEPRLATSAPASFAVAEPEEDDPDNGDPDNGDPDDEEDFQLFVPGLEKDE
ncbi:MAG: IPT/TIG domain-containing protein, partial [Litorilinea sp.]